MKNITQRGASRTKLIGGAGLVKSLARKSPALSASYGALKNKVRETLLQGQERIEREKVRTYLEIGRLINQHLLGHKNRADYGKDVIEKLSKDLEVGERLLYQCTQFAREFKNLHRGADSGNLTWSHYRKLMSVKGEPQRKALIERVMKSEWTATDLQTEIKKEKMVRQLETTKEPPELLKPIRGSLYTYRLRLDKIIQSAEPALRVDLGFSCYKEMLTKAFKAGDVIESVPNLSSPRRRGSSSVFEEFILKKSPRITADLFTYKAYIERVIDGDTLVAQVDLGFNFWTRQTLRLRGIDCPEIDTPEGKRAKKFVEAALENVPYVIISSTKPDKYDRYLADIFYQIKDGQQFLNNELLEERFAVKW